MKTIILETATPLMRQVVLLILSMGAQSLAAATSALRASRSSLEPGLFTAKNDLPIAFDLAQQIRKVRSMKRGRVGFRTHEWYGHSRTPQQSAAQYNLKMDRARLAERFRSEPLRHRLSVERRLAALEAAKRVMKHGASGGSVFHVTAGDNPDYHVEVEKEWSRVNQGKDRWASRIDTHHITVSRSWLAVHKRIGDGTAIIDGRFLLDARLFLEAGERRIWEATLARSGRGFQAVVENVWLSAYGRDVTVHRDLKKALGAPPPDGSIVLPCEDEEFLAARRLTSIAGACAPALNQQGTIMKRPALVPEDVDVSHLREDQRTLRDTAIRMGRLGFGDRWQVPCCAALGLVAGRKVSSQQLNHWLAGSRPIPNSIGPALQRLGPQLATDLERRTAEIRGLWPPKE